MVLFKEILSPYDEYFKDAINIYNEAFESTPDIYLDPKVFSESSGRVGKDVIWHLCVLTDGKAVAMTAFGTCIYGGFGGYIAVKEGYRHHGYGTMVLEMMKDKILKDSHHRNWNVQFLFAEYEEKNKGLWESKGFFTLPIEYFQPPLADVEKWIPMSLGVVSLSGKDMILGSEIFNFIRLLYSKIYYVRNYSIQEHYIALKKDCEKLSFNFNTHPQNP